MTLKHFGFHEYLSYDSYALYFSIIFWLVSIIASLYALYFAKYLNDVHYDACAKILDHLALKPTGLEPKKPEPEPKI